jgi:hypothetical protein
MSLAVSVPWDDKLAERPVEECEQDDDEEEENETNQSSANCTKLFNLLSGTAVSATCKTQEREANERTTPAWCSPTAQAASLRSSS